MSRRRVITGADERGRPITTWEGGGDSAEPAYGHMVPAYDSTTIERRQATPEERARWSAEAAKPVVRSPITDMPTAPNAVTRIRMPETGRYTPDELHERRQRGQAAMRAVVASKPPEETAMTVPAAPEPDLDGLPPSDFTKIAAAAIEAAQRQHEVAAAKEAVSIAEERLAAATSALEGAWASAGLPGPLVAVPAAADPASSSTRSSTSSRPARSPRLPSGMTARQEQVLEAVRASGGSMSKAAGSLRTSEANVRTTLHSIGEKKLLPADVLAMLPESWTTKYGQTVAA